MTTTEQSRTKQPDGHQSLEILQKQSYQVSFDLSKTPYRACEKIGTGAYGVVCSALNPLTGEKVAIKKITNALHNPTVAKRTLREVKILRQFDHDNIIAVLDMFHQLGSIGSDVYIVFDLMETDLHRIIHSKQPLSMQHVQYFLYQILRGLCYIHSANIIHRDLKPSNLMVNADCLLKIGDFGMARVASGSSGYPGETAPTDENQFMTQYVATRWYRAPELLFSMLSYTTAVDLWSTGCILAEMINRRQLFPGKDQLSQLKLVVCYLGTPSKEVMNAIPSELVRRIIVGLGPRTALPFATIIPKAPPEAIELLDQLLTMAPWRRPTAEAALAHTFLEQFHDPELEPICSGANFGTEVEDLPKDQIGDALLSEVNRISLYTGNSLFRNRSESDGSRVTRSTHSDSIIAAPAVRKASQQEDVKMASPGTRSTRSSASDVEMLSANFEECLVLRPENDGKARRKYSGPDSYRLVRVVPGGTPPRKLSGSDNAKIMRYGSSGTPQRKSSGPESIRLVACVPVTVIQRRLSGDNVTRITRIGSSGQSLNKSFESLNVSRTKHKKPSLPPFVQDRLDQKATENLNETTLGQKAEDTKAKLRNALLQAIETKRQQRESQVAPGGSDQKPPVVTAQVRHLQKLERRRKRDEKRNQQAQTVRNDDGSSQAIIPPETESMTDQNLLQRWSRMQAKAKQNMEKKLETFSLAKVFNPDARAASKHSETKQVESCDMEATEQQSKDKLATNEESSNEQADSSWLQGQQDSFRSFPPLSDAGVANLAQDDQILYRDPVLAQAFTKARFSSTVTPQAEPKMATSSSENSGGSTGFNPTRQIGDIISEALPSLDSSLSSREKTCDSAQLMEDWLAATDMKPEDLIAIEQEISMNPMMS